MIIQQVWAIVNKLEPIEKRELAAFLASQFFNKGKNALAIEQLYQSILDLDPVAADESFAKKVIPLKITHALGLDEGKLDKVIYDLHKLLRQYAIVSQYLGADNEAQHQIDWAKWTRIRDLSEISHKNLVKLKEKAMRKSEESTDNFRKQMLVEEEIHMWETSYNKVKGDLNIPDLIHSMDLVHFNYRIELINRYFLQQKATTLPDISFDLIDLEQLAKESHQLEIALRISRILKKSPPPPEDILILMEDLKQFESKLSFETQRHFYSYMRSFCTLLINSGRLDFIQILHQVNKDNFTRGLMYLNGKLPSNAYFNLVQVALRTGDISWAKEITEDQKDNILEGQSDLFYYKFNMAYCFFAEKAFDKASEVLPDILYNGHYHHMIRILELKIYYELKSELLPYKIDAFRKYIERTAEKSLSGKLLEMDINFVNILIQLYKTPFKDKKRSERLIQRIENKKSVAERQWLLEKARELG